jgi:hypothetical protein
MKVGRPVLCTASGIPHKGQSPDQGLTCKGQHDECDVGQRVSRRHAFVASAGEGVGDPRL